jgi:hypothetical protein
MMDYESEVKQLRQNVKAYNEALSAKFAELHALIAELQRDVAEIKRRRNYETGLTPWQSQPWRPAVVGLIIGTALMAGGMLFGKFVLLRGH